MVKSTTEAKYLGAVINDKADPAQEIRRRISSTMPVLKRLDIFWNKTKCSKSWKLLDYYEFTTPLSLVDYFTA